MGFLADSLRTLLLPELKSTTPIAATVSSYDLGRGQLPPTSYDRNARDGYMLDELVYQCIEIRADAAGEPPMCAYRLTSSGEEKVTDDPALTLLNRPNPFMGRSRFWGTVVMHLDIGGNAYIEKVRSGSGEVVELWLLRPDRVTVRPDAQTFIGGYTYRLGEHTFDLPPEDVIHIKTRHPLDDFYGLPPLAVLAGRVDLDVWARKFTEAFFRNAGVPAGLLNIQRGMNRQEQEDMRRRFREIYGGEQGWHKILVLDGGQATYTSMGVGMGANGAAMPELNEINETRILGVFGVPLSLIPTVSGSRANRGQTANVSERALFWEETMVPLFRDIDSMLSAGLQDEFPQFDRFEHDVSKVHALQEDENAKWERYGLAVQKSMITVREARSALGLPEEPEEPGVFLVSTTMVPTPSDALFNPEPLLAPPEDLSPAAPAALPSPVPAATGAASTPPAQNGRTNGAPPR